MHAVGGNKRIKLGQSRGGEGAIAANHKQTHVPSLAAVTTVGATT